MGKRENEKPLGIVALKGCDNAANRTLYIGADRGRGWTGQRPDKMVKRIKKG